MLNLIGEVNLEYIPSKLRIHSVENLVAISSFDGPRVDVLEWGIQGGLRRVGALSSNGMPPYSDMDWHPSNSTLALVGGGRPITLWPVRTRRASHTVGWTPDETAISQGKLKIHILEQGFSSVSFSHSGDRLIGGTFLGDHTYVYGIDGSTLGTIPVRSGSGLVRHPRLNIISYLGQMQLASEIGFLDTTSLRELEMPRIRLPADGYMQPSFSPDGNLIATIGNAYEISINVFDISRNVKINNFIISNAWDSDWTSFGARRPGKGVIRWPEVVYADVRDLASSPYYLLNRIAFAPDGEAILFADNTGEIKSISKNGIISTLKKLHDHSIVSLDVDARREILGTADYGGSVRIWEVKRDITALLHFAKTDGCRASALLS